MRSKHMLALIYIHRLQAFETHPGHRTRSVKLAPQVGSGYASCRGMNESAAAVMTLQQNIKIHKILSFFHFFFFFTQRREKMACVLVTEIILYVFSVCTSINCTVTFMTAKRKEEGEQSGSDGDVFVLGHTVPPSGLHCSIFFLYASRPAND